MSKRKNYDHKKNMQRKNKLRVAKRSSALLAAAAIVVTPYVYDSEQKTLSKYTAEAADIAVIGNQTLSANYSGGILTLTLRGNQLANIGAISNYSPNFQLPEELSSLLQNPNIRSQTTINYSIPYVGVGGVANLTHTGSVTGSNLTVNTTTNSFGANIRHTLGIAVSSPTTFTARINLANLGITQLPTASDGRLDFRAIAADSLIANVDLLNRRGAATSITTGITDTQPPAAPVLSSVDSDDTTLTGTAEANSRINITLPDGSTATATTDANGNWSAAIPAQQAGGTISATATDAAGNRSSAGTVSVTNADTEPPAAPVINSVDSDDTTVSGTAEAGTVITLTLGDGSTVEATTDEAGNWSAEIPAQAADTTITAVATDDAGNESDAASATVTNGDTEAPATPEISPIDSDDTTLSGTAEAGSAITITLPNGSTVETEADDNGNWSAEIPAQDPDSDISVTSTDAAGNQSDPGSVTVTNAGGGADTEPPAAPVIAPVTDEDTTLTGTAEANADIVVTLPDGSTAETTADADGNWTVEIPAQTADSSITAVAVDEAGNESEAGNVTVTDADSEAPTAPEFNPIDSDDTSLSGTAEPNTDIIVTLPDGSSAETTTDADGNWTVDIPAQEANSDITAIAVDEAGNESDAGSVTVTDADTEAPGAPEINPIDSDDTSLSGTAEPNTDIVVTLPDGSTVETTTDADGNWTVDIPAQEADSEISAVAVDEAGNESDAGSVTVTDADTEAPGAPEINPIDSDDTSLSGTAEPNTDIVVTLPDGSTLDTTTDADGNWTVDIPAQETGSVISVTATDEAGNESDAGTATVTNSDTEAPAAPEVNPVDSDDTSLSGTAEPNTDVVLTFSDGTTVETRSDADGNWNIEIPAQEPGTEISVVAIDDAGNQSDPSTVVVINYDSAPPAAPEINPVTNADTSISGTAEANATIIVTLADGTTAEAIADSEGDWTAEIPAQDPGSEISAIAIDEAGNESESESITVANSDTTAPIAPEVDPLDSDDTSLSGTAEANTDIIVTLPNGASVRTTADADGNWTVDIPSQDPDAVLSVVAVDEARNISSASTVVVTNADTTAPAAPEINAIDSDDTSLSGTTEANADVIVTLPNGTSVRTTADADGNWTVDIPAQSPGAALSVVAIDEARNISGASTVVVTNADTTAPDAPEVNPVDSDDTSLSGTAEPDADIIVTLPDGTSVRTTADADGNWTVDIPAQSPGAALSVVAVDEARNVSSASTVVVTNADTTAPEAPEVDPVNSDDTSLAGTAEPNSNIIVTLPNGSTISTTTDEQGNWSVDIPAQDPNAILSVVAVDEARNVSSSSSVVVTNADTTAPEAPVVNAVDSDDTTLSGTAEPDADIIVTLPDGTSVRTTADADGNWTVDVPAQSPGASLSVVAVDEARNVSGTSTVVVTNADTTAPEAPEVNAVDSDDTTLSGTAEPNADIIITLPNGSTINTATDAQGNWSVDIPAQDPDAILSVVAVDEARNVSGSGSVVVTNADTTAPDTPEVNAVDSDDTTLSGTAEPNADIIVTLPNGSTINTTADAQGNWSVDIPTQESGAVLSVVAVDEARNVSNSANITVQAGESDIPAPPVAGPITANDNFIFGLSGFNSFIFLYLPDGTVIETRANDQGQWSAEIPPQDAGSEITIIETDQNGNSSEPTVLTVGDEPDTEAPATPIALPVSNTDTSLTGIAEPDTTVVVTLPNGTQLETVSDTNGNWVIDIPTQEAGAELSIISIDAAGNLSASQVVSVIDNIQPESPAVDPITDEDTSLSGDGEPESTVVITLPDGSIVEAPVDEDGNWETDIPAQEPGDEITVVVTDPAGNVSDPVVVPVENSDTQAPDAPSVDPVTDEDTNVSGDAEPGSTVVITLPDGSIVDAPVNEEGNWQAEIPAQESGEEINIVVTDPAGNVSNPVIVPVENSDTEAPDSPSVDPVTDEDTNVSGDGEPGSTVIITVPDGSTVEAPVDEDGNWQAEIPAQEPGDEIIVVVTDPAGNVSNPVVVPVENGDTEAPDAPSVDPVTDENTNVSGDGEPGSTIVITLPDGGTVDTPVDEDGNWEAEIPAQEPGDEIVVVITDPDGNVSDPVIVPVENSDTQAPDAPAVDPVTDEDTNVSGDGEPGSTVVITLPDGETVVEAPVDEDGNWEAEIPAQEPGDEIIVVVTDPEGNVSDPVIVPVENGDTQVPDAPSVDPVTDEDTIVSGDGEPGSTVVITLPDGGTVEAPVDENGNWEAEVPAQEPGEEIVVVITDPEGNVSNPVVVPVENGDTETPDAPAVDPVTDEDTIVSGDGEPGSTIVITLPDGGTVEAPVDENGNWETEIPAQDPGEEIIVVITDPDGNLSDPVIVPVEDENTEAPDAPSVDPITDNDTDVSGDAEPGSTVVITLPDGSTVETPVDENGNWEADIPVQEPGDEIIVVVIDPDNNASAPVIVPVEGEDTEAPDTPSVDPVTDEDTNVSGDGEPGSTVVITLPDGSTVEAPVDEDGNWEVDIPAQDPGDEVIVVITDPAGNESDPVNVPVENADTEAPDSPSVDPVTDEDTNVSGDGEPGSTVVITLPDGSTIEAPVDEDGNWEADIPAQDPGDEVIVVITDPAGNESDPVIVPVENGDIETPDSPSVNPIDEGDDTISGGGTPGTGVIVILPGGNTEETTVDDDGNWSVPAPGLKPGDEITVIGKDSDGNEGKPTRVTVGNNEEGGTNTSTALPGSGSSDGTYDGRQLPQTSNNFFTSILISAGALIAGAISLVASRFRRKNQ
ncbi:Ig-like domain-containing protein [Terribacillus saccharophilus]|uniref:Ig-like domain-containing protein n=1 Tax=Terribacillus saccharophilus TaxID=361277 RepID=UPI002989D581|nr:Ig-like domain-containing protein [Terribacillus saccharophilus]MCM3225621.1 Ig-like domain-containing protein [Terribacillus saccharophilus]